ncbi:hypothetical protein BJ508DRAFT_419426 [Ascobolus immersus RN42]|uniref:Uncharacterized protein n=1 Tax=Ascobolus immersus RN42 TaxID=1160509 RepID=A0A3N4HS70_ASCIM|nr:hypothetical protein BJ508DRAFT_419426 [Ascobolus immersus RN42]
MDFAASDSESVQLHPKSVDDAEIEVTEPPNAAKPTSTRRRNTAPKKWKSNLPAKSLRQFLLAINTLDDIVSVNDERLNPHLKDLVREMQTVDLDFSKSEQQEVFRQLDCETVSPTNLFDLFSRLGSSHTQLQEHYDEASRRFPPGIGAKFISFLLYFYLMGLLLDTINERGYMFSTSHIKKLFESRVGVLYEISDYGSSTFTVRDGEFLERAAAGLARPTQYRLIVIVMEELVKEHKTEMLRFFSAFARIPSPESDEHEVYSWICQWGGEYPFELWDVLEFLFEMRSERQEVLIWKYLHEE